jgi:hypothetical protein
VSDPKTMAPEEQQQGLWRNCEDSIRHALQRFSEGAYEDDDSHHRKWALLSVAHAAETYGNLLLCIFDPQHPPKGYYPQLKKLREALKEHKRLSAIEREVFDVVLKDLADQRNTLMHEPAPEKPKVTDAAIALLSLLHIIRRRTGLLTKEFIDQSPPVEQDILEHIPARDHQRWFDLAERLARAEHGDSLEGCDNCGACAIPPGEPCQACFSERRGL